VDECNPLDGGVHSDDDGEGESDDATYDLFEPVTVGKRKECLPQHPGFFYDCREQRYYFDIRVESYIWPGPW
jgi:hypothetical protein